MMLLVGINPYNFADQKTGQQIQGYTCHVLNDRPDSQFFAGRETFKFSLNEKRMIEFLQGRNIDDVVDTEVKVIYNKYGKVSELISVE